MKEQIYFLTTHTEKMVEKSVTRRASLGIADVCVRVFFSLV